MTDLGRRCIKVLGSRNHLSVLVFEILLHDVGLCIFIVRVCEREIPLFDDCLRGTEVLLMARVQVTLSNTSCHHALGSVDINVLAFILAVGHEFLVEIDAVILASLDWVRFDVGR